jgi:DMSO/TMAO reductase YedYZ heme-binding membrane subunit/NAD(P)H-flavin reductase
VKNTPGVFSHRTSLSAWSNRVGILAYALTPLSVALATRESILTLLTGIPYQSFNFIHRWLGRIIFIQGMLHSIGWFIIELRLYQPQPKVWDSFMTNLYAIWGLVAFVLLFILWVLSLGVVIKRTGYEFFKKSHYILAMVYIGACWGHWAPIACWMIASLAVWGLDRGIRFLRTILIHTRKIDGSTGCKFVPSQATINYFDDPDGGVVRLEMTQNYETWQPGQHFFLNFPALTIWQSHPLTVMSLANGEAAPRHVYIARARKGETGRLKALAFAATSSLTMKDEVAQQTQLATTPVVLCGPYGPSLFDHRKPQFTNILALAGGTGVSLTLPLALASTAQPYNTSPNSPSPPAIDFVWMVRRYSNIDWCKSELEVLRHRARQAGVNLRIHIFVTKESRSQHGNASLQPASTRDAEKVVTSTDNEQAHLSQQQMILKRRSRMR